MACLPDRLLCALLGPMLFIGLFVCLFIANFTLTKVRGRAYT